jgi:hypothetical protein
MGITRQQALQYRLQDTSNSLLEAVFQQVTAGRLERRQYFCQGNATPDSDSNYATC